MEALRYLLITLLCAGVLGAVFGVIMGKHLVKKAKYGSKPLLKPKERLIYIGCVALGVVCICVGLFFQFPGAEPPVFDGEAVMDGGGATAGGGGMTMRGGRGGVAYAVRVG